MIKHIFELDRQAQEYAAMELATVNTGGVAEFNRLYRNKFAELIVKECMDCSTWVGKMNNNPIEPVHTARAINQRIREHFGVEE